MLSSTIGLTWYPPRGIRIRLVCISTKVVMIKWNYISIPNPTPEINHMSDTVLSRTVAVHDNGGLYIRPQRFHQSITKHSFTKDPVFNEFIIYCKTHMILNTYIPDYSP